MDLNLNISSPDEEGAAAQISPTRCVCINGEIVESKLNPEAHEFKPSMYTQWRVAQPNLFYESDESMDDKKTANNMSLEGYSGEQHCDMQLGASMMGNAIDISEYPDTDKKLRVLYAKDGVANGEDAAALNGVVKLMRLEEHGHQAQNTNNNENVKRYTHKELFSTEEPESLHVLEKVEQFEKLNAANAVPVRPDVMPPPPPQVPRAVLKNRERQTVAVNAEFGNCIGVEGQVSALYKQDGKLHESGGDSRAAKISIQKDTLNVTTADMKQIADAKDGRVPPGTPEGPFVNTSQEIKQEDIKLKVEKKWSLKKLTSFVGGKKTSSKQPPPAAPVAAAKAMPPPATAAVSSSSTSNSSTFSITSGKKSNTSEMKSPSLHRKQLGLPSPHDVRKSEANTRLVARTVSAPTKAGTPQRSAASVPKISSKDSALGKKGSSPEKARAKVTEKPKGKSTSGIHK